jgi:peptidyl-tRNA hydrolase, PTH1 family
MRPDFNSGKIRVIIGLGNPEEKYKNTYHNAGKLAVQYFKELLNSKFYILNSNVYMNLSGSFVAGALKKKGAGPEELLLVHDDSDLELGSYKIDFARGAAGHKGVESVIKALGTKNFWRLRIGIRPAKPKSLISRLKRRKKAGDFVLKTISKKDLEILENTFEEISRRFAF